MQRGSFEFIVGPMFAGKTEELLRRIKRATIARQKVVLFKPLIDDRYSINEVVSHSGQKLECVTVDDSISILSLMRTDYSDYNIICIDEVQFFDASIVEAIKCLISEGRRVIATGLSVNFRGELFNPQVGELMALASQLDKLTAICKVCGTPAVYNMRMIDGKPANWDSPVVLVGGEESYEARCYKCFSCKHA